MHNDTIFALSSGRPPAAISVIRVSGQRAQAAGAALAGSLPPARQAAVREIRDGRGDLLDQALVLRFDGPASSTGEDTVELHCHGGRAVVAAVLAALAGQEGVREAKPGEFTRRAFSNGKIDLTEAEGLADLIEAETESQRRAAMLMAEGGLRKQIDTWRQRLLELSARAEAAIDYVDEDSVDSDPALAGDCAALVAELRRWLERPRAELLRDGLLVVLAGPPNAGKSSLLNAIVGQERAIVTEVPGTTRDHIEVPLSLSGLPVRLTDTAGLRETANAVEQIGVGRTRELVERADLLVWLGEPEESPRHPHLISVHAKADLPNRGNCPAGAIPVSSLTGAGIAELIEEVRKNGLELLPSEGEVALNRRQSTCVARAYAALQHARDAPDAAIVADAFRQARVAFDELTGRAGVEDMLDALFGRFCIGK